MSSPCSASGSWAITWRKAGCSKLPQPTYATARVIRADIENIVLATGTLLPFAEVDVGTRATGQLISLKVKLGDHVHAGDLLAEIDPKLAESALKEAQAKLVDLEAQNAAATARLQKSLLDARREHGLIRGAATSAKEVQAADAQRKADEAGIVSLDAQIVQAKSRIDTEATNLSYTKIFAPIDGNVVAILTKEGQTVVASQIVPIILKLAQLDVITVRSNVSEADIDSVEVGQNGVLPNDERPDGAPLRDDQGGWSRPAELRGNERRHGIRGEQELKRRRRRRRCEHADLFQRDLRRAQSRP